MEYTRYPENIRLPDLVVGIDVGMSCTGVAYLNRTKGSSRINVFRDWGAGDYESKVPTRLGYRNGQACQWGFECQSSPGVQIREWFKTSFGNPQLPENERQAVRRMYLDYLTGLYKQLKHYFSTGQLNNVCWEEAKIQFLFSVPATWDHTFSDEILSIAVEAGFKSCPDFIVKADIKEPHAVAAYTLSSEPFLKNGETMLVVDAGGGTVDLCLLQVENAEKNNIRLDELAPSQGLHYGATFVDRAFEDLVQERLAGFDNMDRARVESLAWSMKNDPHFQRNKHQLGTGLYNDDQTFKITIPESRDRTTDTDTSRNIENGQMIFTWSDLKGLFDPQVRGIAELVDEFVARYEGSNAVKPIDHVILSGGLGRSTYVFTELSEHIQNSEARCLQGTKMQHSSDPQLCVCLGIVEDAMQTINSNAKMFQRRISAVSLGVSCQVPHESMLLFSSNKKELQKEAKSQGMVTQKDADGNRWIKGYMDWFVRRGTPIQDNKSIKHPYSIPFGAEVLQRDRVGFVLIKTCNTDPIPRLDNDHRVRDSTILKVNLSDVSKSSIKKKSHARLMMGKKSDVRIYFYIEARIGHTEVSFHALDRETLEPLSDQSPVELLYNTEEMQPTQDAVRREER